MSSATEASTPVAQLESPSFPSMLRSRSRSSSRSSDVTDSGGERHRRLPEPFIVNARALANGELIPVEPRHASTVVLLRDHPAGMQAYLLRRTMTMAFAAGM